MSRLRFHEKLKTPKNKGVKRRYNVFSTGLTISDPNIHRKIRLVRVSEE
jgi:hypothetical protein